MTDTGESDLQDWLQEVRTEYWERLGVPDSGGNVAGCTHVLFEVAGVCFAVEAPLCKGVLRRPRTTRLPGLPGHLLGVSGIRGEVVSVVDPRLFLSLTGERPVGQVGFLLLIAHNGVKAALWVDRVVDVVNLSADTVLAAEAPWAHLPEGILLGQWGEGDAPVFVLDGARLLTASAVG
ncbi:MAG: chemotaxis protein CheW [Deferrisomatales bacterium]|nr:chemotaxis protein CheW [Deferrisomatales bacterium]